MAQEREIYGDTPPGNNILPRLGDPAPDLGPIQMVGEPFSAESVAAQTSAIPGDFIEEVFWPEMKTSEPTVSPTVSKVSSAFPYLNENGFYSVLNGSLFRMREGLRDPSSDFEIALSQIFQLLGVSTTQELRKVLDYDSEERKKAKQTANRLTLGKYGLDQDEGKDKSDKALADLITDYSSKANVFFDYVSGRIYPDRSERPSKIELSQDVADASSPADLICIILDKKNYGTIARFQAKAKLQIMDIVAEINKGNLQQRIEDENSRFMSFARKSVLKGEQGNPVTGYLVSDHNEDDFSAKNVRSFSEEEDAEEYARNLRHPTKDEIEQRTFTTADGRDLPIYFHTRPKSPNSQIEKIMRKGDKNRERAIADYLGTMIVLPDKQSIEEFKKALVEGGKRSNIMVSIRTEEDTLDGDSEYSAENTGSSRKLKQYKMVIEMLGMNIELIAHTHKTWIDYNRQDEVGRKEFELTRILELAEAMLPYEIYGIDVRKVAQERIERLRAEKRIPKRF